MFGKGKCKLIANFSAKMVTSLPSVSESLSLSLSHSHRAHLTHNIGSASTLPIVRKASETKASETKASVFVLPSSVLIPKTIGNRKRDCAWDCAWGINTTSENLQIEKHKSVRWAERTPSWFVLFDLQIFSGGVYSPSATSRTISFSISNSFWY